MTTETAVAADAADAGAALDRAATLAGTVAALVELVVGARRWSADDRRGMLDRLDHAIDGLTSVRAAVLVAERAAGTWQGAGDRSFEAWRARTCRHGQRAAAAQVRQAEGLAEVPSVASAVASGRITLEHAASIARVAGSGTAAQRAATSSAEGQDALLGLADGMDAGAFAVAVARWAAAADPDGLERDHEAQRAERYLSVTTTPRGAFVKGRLDSIAGHRLTLALEAVTPRPGADDDRDAGQRAADALDTLARRVLALSDTRPGGHVPPQISMILTEATWAAARARREATRRRSAGDHPPVGHVGADAPAGATTCADPATLEDGTPVPASVLAAAMCDCELTRIVVDADSVPLDLGRAERVFTGQQRRAVIARDRECAWPTCHAQARWCEVHHIRWWERDAGPTSVENGVLLCSFHHHEVHRRDLTTTRLGPVRGGAPPGGGAGAGGAAVTYTFRDRAGRAVGEPARGPGLSASPDAGSGSHSRAAAPPGTATAPTSDRALAPPGPCRQGELTWTGDP